MIARRRVIKVGGSLLDLPDLVERIHLWLSTQPELQNIFVIGGGEFCNELRRLHQRFRLPEQLSHDLSLAQMSVTAQLLAHLLSLPLLFNFERLPAQNEDLVFDCQNWIAEKKDVPNDWTVTSDSISALLASELDADLCLLKSTSSKTDVDAYFQTASSTSKNVEWVNLRDDVP